MPVGNAVQFRHKDDTVYCLGEFTVLLRQKSNHEKIKKHMILVKSWLSLNFLGIWVFCVG